MLVGILAGLATCALWGLSFVGSRAVLPFSAVDLTVLRYGSFGLVSAILLFFPRFRRGSIRPSRLLVALGLGSFGYIGYFLTVSVAVQLAGPTIPPLFVGAMPIALAVIGAIREPVVRMSQLALPLTITAAGIALVNGATFLAAPSADTGSIIYGSLAAIGALVIWVLYGLENAKVMRASDAPDALHWTCLQGLGALTGSLLLLPLTSLNADLFPAAPVWPLLAWGIGLGLAGSWLATWFWVVAATRLPLALCAQLIVAETLFGLGYGYMFEARWPSVVETLGALLQVTGVLAGIRVFNAAMRPKPN